MFILNITIYEDNGLGDSDTRGFPVSDSTGPIPVATRDLTEGRRGIPGGQSDTGIFMSSALQQYQNTGIPDGLRTIQGRVGLPDEHSHVCFICFKINYHIV